MYFSRILACWNRQKTGPGPGSRPEKTYPLEKLDLKD